MALQVSEYAAILSRLRCAMPAWWSRGTALQVPCTAILLLIEDGAFR